MGFHDGSITLITMEAPRESRGFAFQERENKYGSIMIAPNGTNE